MRPWSAEWTRLCLTTLYGFHSLQLCSADPCRPFDAARDGLSIGEAAAFALLERVPDNLDADDVLLLGVGESSDAHHMSAPHPDGAGARRAMQAALRDRAELAARLPSTTSICTAPALRATTARRARRSAGVFGAGTPCSSTKGATRSYAGRRRRARRP